MSNIEKFEPQPISEEYTFVDNTSEEPQGNIMDIIGPVLRRWYIIVLTMLVVSGTAIPLIWHKTKPTYSSVGAIQIKPILTNILTGAKDSGEISNYQMFKNTQADLIQRDIILRRVADSLRDEGLSIFAPGSNPVQVLRSFIDKEIIHIVPDKNNEYLKIIMSTTVPDESEAVVNAFLNAYIAVDIENQSQGEGNRLNTLKELQDTTMNSIILKQKDINDLAREYGMEDMLTSRQANNLEKIKTFQSEVTRNEIKKFNLTAQLNILNKIDKHTISVNEMMASQTSYINADARIQNLSSEIADEQRALIRLRELVNEEHPDYQLAVKTVNSLEKNLSELKVSVAEEFTQMMEKQQSRNKESKIKELETQIEETTEFINIYRNMLAEEEGATKGLSDVQLRIQDLKDKLILEKEKKTQIDKAIQQAELEDKRPARVSIAYKANTSGPFDKRKKMMGGAVAGSFALGLLLAFLLSKLDSSLRTPDDVLRCVDLPVLGTTTGLNQMEREALPQQVADDYQAIRANLGLFAGEGIPDILIVTSAGVQEGKTTFSINLASSMAKGGKKVLLIDGDFRKPDIGQALSLNGKPGGLQKVLMGALEIENAVSIVQEIGLHVLTADPFNIAGTFELIARKESADIIRKISQEYDHIIIDTAPLLAASDALLWSKMADAVVLVSYSGQTAAPDLKEAYQRLSRINARVLGTVLHSVNTGSGYHRYGYGYYSGAGRGKRRRSDDNRPLLLQNTKQDN